VVDGVFGEELSKSLRREILALRSTPLFHANATHLVKDGETHLLQKKNIWEAEAMAPDVQVRQVYYLSCLQIIRNAYK
jgi:hypothetical protein